MNALDLESESHFGDLGIYIGVGSCSKDIITFIKDILPEKVRIIAWPIFVAGCLVPRGERQTRVGFIVYLPKMQRAGALVPPPPHTTTHTPPAKILALEYKPQI